ncbi:hypothetical protein [Opitutus sp. ER46]|uniref:hypothetical protein n=1 Tax=Opitutus sp. ER46 TaxID=2161864 RepID=UPI000D2FED8C|nr:hypothetical protein [Opitutus sp. ER46]PTX91461.1 hypothetical protein DB354_16360 [Opitutus sp. ER46]
MQRFALLTFLLLAAPWARADWCELRAGMDRDSAWRCAGVPLLQNEARGGNAMWTYDRCGYIIFERGRVAYWDAPKPEPKKPALAKTTPPAPAPARPAAPAPASRIAAEQHTPVAAPAKS